MQIVPFIPKTKRGFPPTVPLVEIINAILHKLKTGVQWNQLPVRVLFEGNILKWNAVYFHYIKCCLSDILKNSWVYFLKNHKKELDLSSVDLDGSHTPAIRGGSEVEYQCRKKRKTTSAFYLSDKQGLTLAMSEPISGSHNDLHDIEVQFELVTDILEYADISVEYLFLNTDAGFDS